MKRSLLIFFILLVVVFTSMPNNIFANEEITFNDNKIIESIERKIIERIQLGHKGFDDLNVGKIIKLKDQEGVISKALVELININKDLSGYMIVDMDMNYEIVEFALGDVHPLMDLDKQDDLYYLGPLSYAKSIEKNQLLELRTDQVISKDDIKNLKEKRINMYNEPQKFPVQTTANTNVSNYDYKLISSVPDYQQSDNTSMDNDCVPTSAANVLMYWDKNGFSNMSSNNNWKTVANRIGTIMGHTNSSGVYRSKIVPGLQKYIKERGYANSFTISRDTSPSFSKMKTLIKNGNPSMMSTNGWITQTGGHNITLVGYEEYYATFKFKWYRSVIVRDNWKSTPKDVWFLYGSEDVDDIYKIVKN